MIKIYYINSVHDQTTSLKIIGEIIWDGITCKIKNYDKLMY